MGLLGLKNPARYEDDDDDDRGFEEADDFEMEDERAIQGTVAMNSYQKTTAAAA